MKSLIFLLFAIIFPLREVVDVQISIPTHQHDIFFNYSNDNFSQVIVNNDTSNKITAHIKNSNYFSLNLNFRIIPNKTFIAHLHPELRKNIRDLVDNCLTFKPYFLNISSFLEGHIAYSDHDLPQDAISVITAKKSQLYRVLKPGTGLPGCRGYQKSNCQRILFKRFIRKKQQ